MNKREKNVIRLNSRQKRAKSEIYSPYSSLMISNRAKTAFFWLVDSSVIRFFPNSFSLSLPLSLYACSKMVNIIVLKRKIVHFL